MIVSVLYAVVFRFKERGYFTKSDIKNYPKACEGVINWLAEDKEIRKALYFRVFKGEINNNVKDVILLVIMNREIDTKSLSYLSCKKEESLTHMTNIGLKRISVMKRGIINDRCGVSEKNIKLIWHILRI